MEVSQLVLPFLGRREYLHGTTVFDALLPLLPFDAAVTFKFSQMIRSNCVAVVPDSGDASLSWQSGSAGAGTLHLKPRATIQPLERRAYPESLVADQTIVTGKNATYEGESPFSFVATLIPMQKALLARNVAPARPGQWVFTRLDLQKRPAAFRQIELQLAAVFQDQLAHSKIKVEGENIGSLYFSWLAQP